MEGGLNLYQYAPNPSQWIDPWGWALKPVIFPKGLVKKDVWINAKGSREWDYRAAIKEAKLKGPSGQSTINAHHSTYGEGEYVWHHASYDPKTNKMRMQLVKVADHDARIPHIGGVADFEAKHKVKYETLRAKNKAKSINKKMGCNS